MTQPARTEPSFRPSGLDQPVTRSKGSRLQSRLEADLDVAREDPHYLQPGPRALDDAAARFARAVPLIIAAASCGWFAFVAPSGVVLGPLVALGGVVMAGWAVLQLIYSASALFYALDWPVSERNKPGHLIAATLLVGVTVISASIAISAAAVSFLAGLPGGLVE